jgi:hypothetical protein
MSKPILAIDIDGVIIPHKDYTVDTFDKETHMMFLYDYASEGWMKIRNDFPEIMQKLMPHFELMWGSGWEEEGNYFLLEALGLEEDLDWIPLKQSLPGYILGKLPVNYYWKTPWIIHWAEETQRPFALIDDLFAPEDFDWAAERTAEGIPTLFIQTKDTIGWTDEHTDQLIAWAEGIKDE